MVFAQELVPGRVGMIAGVFFGFAFGMGGIAAAVLGLVADAKGIEYVFWACSFLPLLGLLTVFLPTRKRQAIERREPRRNRPFMATRSGYGERSAE